MFECKNEFGNQIILFQGLKLLQNHKRRVNTREKVIYLIKSERKQGVPHPQVLPYNPHLNSEVA